MAVCLADRGECASLGLGWELMSGLAWEPLALCSQGWDVGSAAPALMPVQIPPASVVLSQGQIGLLRNTWEPDSGFRDAWGYL